MKDIHDFYFSRYFKEICWYYGEDHIYIEEPGIIAAKIIQNPQRIVSIVQLDDGTQTLNQYQKAELENFEKQVEEHNAKYSDKVVIKKVSIINDDIKDVDFNNPGMGM